MEPIKYIMDNKNPSKFTYYEQPKGGSVSQAKFTYIYNNNVTQPYGFAYFKITDNSEHYTKEELEEFLTCTLEGYVIHNLNYAQPIHMRCKNKEEALQHVRNFGVEW